MRRATVPGHRAMTDLQDLPSANPIAMCAHPAFWRAVRDGDTVRRALWVSLIVGTALIAINQGDVILSGAMPPPWKIVLTYVVPYAVSTYSAVAFKLAMERRAASQ